MYDYNRSTPLLQRFLAFFFYGIGQSSSKESTFLPPHITEASQRQSSGRNSDRSSRSSTNCTSCRRCGCVKGSNLVNEDCHCTLSEQPNDPLSGSSCSCYDRTARERAAERFLSAYWEQHREQRCIIRVVGRRSRSILNEAALLRSLSAPLSQLSPILQQNCSGRDNCMHDACDEGEGSVEGSFHSQTLLNPPCVVETVWLEEWSLLEQVI
jgi:hypothetical protein